MNCIITMTTPLMLDLKLSKKVEERRRIRIIFLNAPDDLSPARVRAVDLVIKKLDYEIKELRDALKGVKGIIQASCN
tara:strand:- start:1625 stop:1855 length:231 start_codon:yes stop_codon:yes gene_type:complete